MTDSHPSCPFDAVLAVTPAPEPEDSFEVRLLDALMEAGVKIPDYKAALKAIEPFLDELGDRRGADTMGTLAQFIWRMVLGATTRQVGQRMIVLAYLAGKTSAKTQRELARQLRVSKPRVSQIIRELPSEFQSLFR